MCNIWCYFFIAELDFMGSFNGTNNEIRKGIPEKRNEDHRENLKKLELKEDLITEVLTT